jgi:O-antigen ligase
MNLFYKIAIYLFSLTQFRMVSFKISELILFLTLLNIRHLKIDKKVAKQILSTFLPFLIFSLYALLLAIYTIFKMPLAFEADVTIEGQSNFLYTPYALPVFSFVRHCAIVFFIVVLSTYLLKQDNGRIKKIVLATYWVTLAFGLYQVAKLGAASSIGIQLPNIPLFERCYDGYSICGIFDAGPFHKRILGAAYEPLDYGASLVTIGLLYYYFLKKLPVVGIILLLFSVSKASILGLVIGIVMVLILRKRFKLIYATIFLAAILFYSALYIFREDLMYYFNLLKLPIGFAGGVGERVCVQMASLKMIADNFMGVGLKMWYFFNRFYDDCGIEAPPNPCNDSLQFLAEGGIPLLAAYLFMVYRLFKFASIDRKLLVIAIALTIQSFTVSIYLIPVFWVMFSFITAEYYKAKPEFQSEGTKS